MKYLIYSLFLFVSAMLPRAGFAATDDGQLRNRWLMIATTNNLDPSKEKEFNDWYNNVDLPAMLDVPGYVRARRGVAQAIAGDSSDSLRAGAGKYVAIYEIESTDIDKTVAALRKATKEFDASSRATNLLVVVQAAIYRQISPTYNAPTF